MLKLLVPFVLLIAAIGASVLTDRPLPKADFTFINRGDVTTLDLQTMSWMQDFRVARLIYEGLVRNDVFTWTYDYAPGVAERWEVSPDARVYTFHLRRNARWSNGDPVTAADFVFAWRRAMLPDLASDYIKLFHLIAGSRAFYAWRTEALEAFGRRPAGERGPEAAAELWRRTLTRFDELVSVAAPDAHTFVVTLDRPTPYFLDLCAFPVFYPVHAGLVRQYERLDPQTGRYKTDHGWTKPPRIISNGPFKLALWRFKRDMRLERNEFFWDHDLCNIDTISIPSIQDPNAQVLAFQTGGVDWVSDVTPPYRADIVADKLAFYREHQQDYDRLKAGGLDPVEIDRRLPPDPRNRIHVFPAFGTYFYNFNCLPTLHDGRDNPFADPRVRRAFAMAIDKESIVNDLRRTGEPPATALIPPGSLVGYRSPTGVPFDPGAARRLLAEAGYPGGRNFMTVELLFNKDGGHDVIAQAIARNWQEHLGVPVSLAQKEIKVFRDEVRNANYITSRGSWFGDYGDPTTFLALSYTNDGNNDRKYSNPVFDDLLDRAASEADPAARMRLLEEAERIIMDEDLPIVPLFHYSQVYLFDPHRLTGISSHPRQEQTLYRVDMLGDGKGSDSPLMLPPREEGGTSRSPG